MSFFNKNKCLFLLCLFFVKIAWGFEPFVVKDIRIEGLQRISAGTVFNYLPVKVGDVLTQEKSAEAIRSLFKTGFFKDVQLFRRDNALIVSVEERPAIAAIKIEGNKDIGTDDLLKGLKEIGLSEGQVFNRQILDKVQQELRRQYFSRGKYGVEINADVTPLTQNRVAILIKISEGRVARIKQINIVGNKAFKDEDLVDEFELSTPTLLSFYTKSDQYSKQKLAADLERLRSFYLDRGYIKFDIESTQVSITPDKREIYITINVKEGDVYRLEEVKLTGDLIVPPDELIPLISVGPGEVFSRKRATETSKAISDRLGEEGYIFANVNMVPEINEGQKTVNMTFFVDPGNRVYVRRINIRGNTKTRDEVLRREMRQMEAAVASTPKIERSKERLERLGYFKEVNIETPAVAGAPDQIDVDYSVVEKPSGNLMAGLGFSQSQGLIFNASITQDNVLGTGKRVNFTFNNSDVSTIYRLGYLNPYYTLDGISRGFDLSYRETDARQANVADYSTDVFAADLNYGIPINEYDRIRFNLDFESTKLNARDQTSNEIQDFIDKQGERFNVFSLALGWSHDTLNRAVFATQGGAQRLSLLAAIPGSDLQYYKISYRQQHYFPIAKDWTLSLNGEIAYGDGYGDTDALPFFENYFAGGVNSIRGFRANTLGPRDSNNRPFGGAAKIAGSAEVFFPVPFLEEAKTVRMGGFFDFGNVFENSFDVGELRYSVGVSAQWLSPFGPLTFSIAQPLNADKEDEVQNFQFSFGAEF